MVRLSRRLTSEDKELLLKQLNKKRKQYGLRPLKTIKTDDLIHLQQQNKYDTPPHPHKSTNNYDDGGMYQ